jgi:hypothetical protein
MLNHFKIVAFSPSSPTMGNDCGAWHCIKLTSYMKAGPDDCLYEESLDRSSGVTFELTDNMRVGDWAALAGRHLLKSLCSGSIDLDDQVVTPIRVRIQVPDCRKMLSFI